MPEVFLFLICAAILWAFLFRWVPIVAQTYAVAKLHNQRDRLYSLARNYPEFRRTRLYLHLDLLYAGTIHVVRDRSGADARQLVRVEMRSTVSQERAQKLAAGYTADAQNALGARWETVSHEIGLDLVRRDLVLTLRGISTLNPAFLVVASGLVLIRYAAFKLFPSTKVSVFQAAEHIERSPTLRTVGDRIYAAAA